MGGTKGHGATTFLSGQVHRYELEWIRGKCDGGMRVAKMVEFLDLLHKLYYWPHEAV